jgi:CNT family concentrative nucleoside transporter
MLLVAWTTAALAEDAHGNFIARPTSILERAMSLVGIFAFCGICWLISEDRSKINWRTVAWGLVLQVAICSVVLIPGLSQSLVVISDAVSKLLSFTADGAKFVFAAFVPHTIDVGPAGAGTPAHFGSGEGISPPLMNFAFWVLPTIVFFSALSNVLYYFGVLQLVVKGIAFVMQRTMGTSGAETLCTAANIFLGQTEAPLLIKPFIEKMTRSELMAVMVGGFATIAVGVLGLYASVLPIPNIAGHLVVASIISAPATFVCAKLVVPERGEPATGGLTAIELPKSEGNLMQAVAIGATDGMRLAINVAAMLIAVVALVAMVNYGISWVPVTFCPDGVHGGYQCAAGVAGAPLDLTRILGWLFFPFALLMGVDYRDASAVGTLLGEKLVLTELVAYFDMGAKLNGPTPIMTERSAIIAAYALCGFANFASVGIQIGGIGALAPSRVKELAELGMKAMIVGSIATCMTGAVVGLFV